MSLDMARVDLGLCLESRRQMRTWWPTPVTGCWVPQVHRGCAHNEIQALKLRLMASTLPPQVFQAVSPEVDAVFRALARHARRYREGKWTLEETAMSYSGAMQRRYLEACRSLREDEPLNRRDAKIKAFLKAEKFNVGPKWMKPRLICPRSPRYNLTLASRLKPFEHWLWGTLTAKCMQIGGQGRLVAKGLNPRRRANLIVRKYNNFKNCVVFEADGAAFEAHVGVSQLQGEQGVYKAAFPGDRELVALLAHQLTLKGRLECGAKFERVGARASGDFNTGMGNTIVMLTVVVAVMKSFGVKFDVLVDGDNCLVFIESEDLAQVMAEFATRSCAWSGQELVVEKPVSVVEEIRFGQSAPVWMGAKYGWTMIRDYRKVLSGATSSHKWLREPNFARTYLQGVARCELSLALGVPVLQAWALHMMEVTDTRKKLKEHAFVDNFMLGAWLAERRESRTVLMETRCSFERAFGLTAEEQKEIEASFSYKADQTYKECLGVTDWRQAEPGLHDAWFETTT
ncbi:RNA-dependent RNA polymerase [Sclerotinia sclerotiorum umbra-like virus 3]|nr:RNA-dependent RNA polymerase [Sclerotinia sclerotiorum umbra-like virus 3]